MQAHRRVRRGFHVALIFTFIFGCFALLQSPRAQAQTRVNDRDMEALMRNLHEDAKSFRPDFDKAVHKSTIRHTSGERDAKDRSAAFERETEVMLHHFKKDRNGIAAFTNVVNSAEEIDAMVDRLTLGPQVTQKWDKIRTELHEIAQAYGVPERFHQRDRDDVQ